MDRNERDQREPRYAGTTIFAIFLPSPVCNTPLLRSPLRNHRETSTMTWKRFLFRRVCKRRSSRGSIREIIPIPVVSSSFFRSPEGSFENFEGFFSREKSARKRDTVYYAPNGSRRRQRIEPIGMQN